MKPTTKRRKAARCRECRECRKLAIRNAELIADLGESSAEIDRLTKNVETSGEEYVRLRCAWFDWMQRATSEEAMLDVLAHALEKNSNFLERAVVAYNTSQDLRLADRRDRDESSRALAEYVKSMAAYKRRVGNLLIALSQVQLKVPLFSDYKFIFTPEQWDLVLRLMNDLEREGRT